MEAINKAHQTTVNRFIKWNDKYDALVNAEKEESPAGERAYEKALDLWCELPKREQANLMRLDKSLVGSY